MILLLSENSSINHIIGIHEMVEGCGGKINHVKGVQLVHELVR
jgi:hypothetical protein